MPVEFAGSGYVGLLLFTHSLSLLASITHELTCTCKMALNISLPNSHKSRCAKDVNSQLVYEMLCIKKKNNRISSAQKYFLRQS